MSESSGAPAAAAEQAPDEAVAPVTTMEYFMQLEYHELLSPNVRRYVGALMDGRIIGHRCPRCSLVYVPPRGYCPICVVRTGEDDEVDLADRGVVTNYTVVTPVQYYGQEETEPFVRASVLLDGPGGMLNLQEILDVPVDEVRVGMRVEAVWVPTAERNVDEIGNRSWGSAGNAISGWRPTGEDDLPAEQFIGKVF